MAIELVGKKNKVYVATSDYAEQWQIFGQGAFRKSARELPNEIMKIDTDIDKKIDEIERKRPFSTIQFPKEIADFFEKFRRGK